MTRASKGTLMQFSNQYTGHQPEIAALFAATFTQSEGADEGALIGQLVTDIFARTDAADLHVFSVLEGDRIIGCTLYTRLRYPQDTRRVYLMSPMAVATDKQGQGVGQRLLAHGLGQLRQAGGDVALTYGDITFYAKAGFAQIPETVAAAPHPLSYPMGWLGQSLSDAPLAPLAGPSHCVEAFNNPDVW